MNILLTSVGRRSYLVEYFKEALGARGQVICVNSRDSAPARRYADHFQLVSESCAPGYVDEIKALCAAHDVRALFSCHDLDTCVLSRRQTEFAGLPLTAFLPSPEWNEVTLDKLQTYRTLSRHGIACPWTTDDLEEARERMAAAAARGAPCLLVLKARFGFGSLGLRRCTRPEQLAAAHAAASAEVAGSAFASTLALLKPGHSQVVMQEYAPGRELRLVIVNDLKGAHLTTLATEVHAMRAGESDSATTLPLDIRLSALSQKLSGLTRHIGIWGIDCIEQDGVLQVLDLNPRFTGDYPFCHLAGADIPRALLALVAGESPRPADLVCRPGVSGYKDLVPRLSSLAPAAAGAMVGVAA
jgi:carbamoyl-phosphate synthase large subunit